MTKRPLPPIGFWSYARPDDELSSGQLSRLRALIRAELQQQYGREQIQLFQDISAIAHGSRWEGEIRRALENSTFFIPILSPNFMQSDWCVQEVEIFQQRQERLFAQYPDLPRTSRIFPVHYIDVAGIEANSPGIDASLRQLQWFDFRAFRHKDFASADVRDEVSRFVSSVRDLLRVKVEQAEAETRAESAAPAPLAIVSTAPAPSPRIDLPSADSSAPVPTQVSDAGPAGMKRNLWIGLVAAGLTIAALIYFLALPRSAPVEPAPVSGSPRAPCDGPTPPAGPIADGVGSANSSGSGGRAAALDQVLVGRWGTLPDCSDGDWTLRSDGIFEGAERGSWSVDGQTLRITMSGNDIGGQIAFEPDGRTLRMSRPSGVEIWHRCSG